MTQRSGLALAVLALLVEEPMHPYRMQQLLRERGKGDVVNVGQRSQLYKTIDRLARDGLIAEHVTERDSTRPERTVYALTADGHETAQEWTQEMLTAPRQDFPEFVVGLAYLPLLHPDVVARAVATRLSTLRTRLAATRAGLDGIRDQLPRVVLVEGEYQVAMFTAEIAWVEALAEDLRTGALHWDHEWMVRMATGQVPLSGD
ncbi:PadR family transcriptional regulator [Pseudonocardia endophytica]|uniref:PadR family transcriptional regulator n=1 Tax=Pseudonocardia endophytica TaxID=401976 RepID=A0A4V2PIY5_PSEEN|nr:PadR family transcriptional regulator [Pseudonocardia endophytica]TCK26476.1 PadR family transcriptional regulator [Pseudonocardia endophytica]